MLRVHNFVDTPRVDRVSTCVYLYSNDSIALHCNESCVFYDDEVRGAITYLLLYAVPCVFVCGACLLKDTIKGNIAMSVKVLCSHLCYVLVSGV